ncbi:MAG: hypothetical protein AAFQ42_08715 [Pseudomonadota bacterium]
MRFFSWLRANILYGAAALIPVAALFLVGWYLYEFWQSVLTPITRYFGLETFDSQATALGLSIAALVIVCFIVGLFVRSTVGSWTFDRLESRILAHVPGYGMLSTLLRGFADNEHAYPAALAKLNQGEGRALCFVMEDGGGPEVTVFVPSVPVMTVGQVYLLPRGDIEMLPNASTETANALTQWGVGTQAAVALGRAQADAGAAVDAPPVAPLADGEARNGIAEGARGQTST